MSRPLQQVALAAAFALSMSGAARSAERASGPAPDRPGDRRQLPPAGTYTLDPPHTFVYFSARHQVVGQVRGRFDKVAGTLVVDPALGACTVDVTIAAASVDTQVSRRDEDLRSAAFFDAASFPTIRYRGRGVRRTARGWAIDGALTIRDVTKTVPLIFEFAGAAPAEKGQPARVAFHARAETMRAQFGMVRELAEEIGLDAGGADVVIEIDAEALAAAKR